MSPLRFEYIRSITELEQSQWDTLWPSSYPFTKYGFFRALEESQSLGEDKGRIPFHLIIYQENTVVAAMPLFIKTHSYGEYVFDWSWADAYQRSGLPYYPKVVNAIPFTPSTGPRIGFASPMNETQKNAIEYSLITQLQTLCIDHKWSGLHCLFPEKSQRSIYDKAKLHQRHGYQFHWFNREYPDFDAFLQTFSSRKRKAIKKERKKITEQNIDIIVKEQQDISPEDWHQFYKLYQNTYLKRSGNKGYLGEKFFKLAAQYLTDQMVLICAYEEQQLIAAALYFKDDNTLYGRYWGCSKEYDGLHFEACYYLGIEYAIKHKLTRFDPGAQGEHKIQRGFTPIRTCSYHWLAQPEFNIAIANFVKEESLQVKNYIDDSRTYLPFKEGIELEDINYLT